MIRTDQLSVPRRHEIGDPIELYQTGHPLPGAKICQEVLIANRVTSETGLGHSMAGKKAFDRGNQFGGRGYVHSPA